MEIKKTVEISHCKATRIKCTARIDMPEYGIVAGERFHLVKVSGSKYAVKKLTITGRKSYEQGVSFEVETTDGKGYTTMLRRAGDHTCSCQAARGTCYHIDIVRSTENARLARLRAEKMAQKAVQTAVAPVSTSAHASLYRNASFAERVGFPA